MRAFLLCVKMPAEHCSALKYASQMCQQEHYATFVEASVDLSLCPGDKKKIQRREKKAHFLQVFDLSRSPDVYSNTVHMCKDEDVAWRLKHIFFEPLISTAL